MSLLCLSLVCPIAHLGKVQLQPSCNFHDALGDSLLTWFCKNPGSLLEQRLPLLSFMDTSLNLLNDFLILWLPLWH